MKKECFFNFLSDEHGAVTVDWVLLVAFVVVSSIAVMKLFGPISATAGCLIVPDSQNPDNTTATPFVEGGSAVTRIAANTQYKMALYLKQLFGDDSALPADCE